MNKYFVISSYCEELNINEFGTIEEAEKEVSYRREHDYKIEAIIKGEKLTFKPYEKVVAYKIEKVD